MRTDLVTWYNSLTTVEKARVDLKLCLLVTKDLFTSPDVIQFKLTVMMWHRVGVKALFTLIGASLSLQIGSVK